MRTLLRKLNSFLGWSWTERRLFAQAYICLGLVRLALLTLPFRWIAKWLGTPRSETPVAGLTEKERVIVGQIARAVRTAAGHTPWKSDCLPQAVTARFMLQGRGVTSTLYLGLAKEGQNREDSDALKAHAWLRSGKFYVVGGAGHLEYTVVATFADGG